MNSYHAGKTAFTVCCRDRFRPFFGQLIPVCGRFYDAEPGGWTPSGHKDGSAIFTQIRLFSPVFEERLFLTKHLHINFERLADFGVHPSTLEKGRRYIIAGRVSPYPRNPNRLGLRIESLPEGLLPVARLGANDCRYARLLGA